ncbi:MAG: hypothetical protein ABIW31_00715 [Novosphingobium sp.]
MNIRFATAVALAACLSMAATPALAHDRGGWGGWGGGYGGGWRGDYDRGIDAGDVIGGLLVIGAIAAIATAASKSNRHRQDGTYRYPDPSYPRYNGSWQGSDQGDYGRSNSIDAAVDTCVSEVERGAAKVNSVDGVNRDGQGWRVAGRTRAGSPYACAVDGTGQLRSVTVDGKAPFRG